MEDRDSIILAKTRALRENKFSPPPILSGIAPIHWVPAGSFQLPVRLPVSTILLPAGPRFAAVAAASACDALGALWPDASAAVIVLPELRAAPGFKRALGAVVAQRGYASVLPPRITTFDAWQESVALDTVPLPRAARIATLHQLLKGRRWFGGAPPWQTCGAILDLADELSQSLPEAPADANFIDLIGRHYRAAAARVAAPEAKLVLEVWRAFAPGAAQRTRLQTLAGRLNAPLIWISTRPGGALADGERRFLDACAARVPVTLIAPDALPAWLNIAWADPDGASLAERASTTTLFSASSKTLPIQTSPIPGLELIAAHSLESEAGAVAARVNAWLQEGRTSIALIAFDRLTARRARALLERDRILLADESGWKLSTTSAATCAMRLVDAIISGFHQRDLIDWLKSPFVFGDVAAAERKAAVALIATAIGRSNVLAGLATVRHAVQDLSADTGTALTLLTRLESAARPWRRRSAPLAEWFALLLATLRDLGALAPLAQDLAGQGVLGLMEDLRGQLEHHSGAVCGIAEWRQCFAAELEAAVFRDSEIDSPVVLTSLAAARLRQFDAVLLIGADAAHLGTAAKDPLFLSTRLRAELKLATPPQRQAQLQDDLGMLIAASGTVAVTWQASLRGDANPLAPWFERLDALSIAAGRGSLIRPAPPRIATGHVADARESPEPPAQPTAPAPRAAVLTPAAVSVSAYGSLIACPYQFFARHLLRLNEPDEVREEFEKRDYGEWVHRLLNRFHQRFPRISGVPHDELKAALAGLADEVFAPAIAFNFLSTGWKLRWMALADSYLDWQQQREDAGWFWHAGEAKADIEIGLRDASMADVAESAANTNSIRLAGRLDRIDTNHAGAIDILDYKTQSRQALQKKVAEAGEDVQLAAYRLLKMEAGAAQASFVSVDGVRVETVAENPRHLPEHEWQRISHLFGAMKAGVPLPANAIDAACNYCEMRGLCRRDYWRSAAPEAAA